VAIELAPLDIVARAGELRRIQDLTMPVPPATAQQRIDWQLTYADRSGFAAFGATDPDGEPPGSGPRPLVGFVFGDTSRPGSWWDNHVRPAAEEVGNAEVLDEALEIVELHVDPAYQGRGIGRALLKRLMTDRPEPWAVLTVIADNHRAWGLYTSLGFTEMSKPFLFAGHEQQYLLMGRPLPLPAAG
jgi:ribosomal protein S18 acetylase RimI-like enzyme